MFWLLKALIFYSDKLNTIEGCVLGLKSLSRTLACMPIFQPQDCCILSNYRVLNLTLCLNCESNECSLCLCVRLCWGRGPLWGTLDSQVTWLDKTLTWSTTTNVHHNTCACLYVAQSIAAAPGYDTGPWMTWSSNHALTNPPVPNGHQPRETIFFGSAVKWPIAMVKPVNDGRWHHSAWVQQTSDSHVSPVICFPVDKRRNLQ